MSDPEVEKTAHAAGLLVMGGFHASDDDKTLRGGGTLILLGTGAHFWEAFRAAPEASDSRPDPVDRWSKRVIGAMADGLGARARFPFGGPPYEPFIDWALRTGRAFQSPTGMLVHDTVGLMISYRGALHFAETLPLPFAPVDSPCISCAERPCLTACPVGALQKDRPYDDATCHKFLDSDAGADCMTGGCKVRRACPISAGAGRTASQSAHHMKAFHPT